MERRDKAAELEKLREEAQAARADTGFAFGEGSAGARLVIVGEAPGKREAELGRPFVGAAGRLLDSLLEQAGINRKDIWITNVVKWRPVQIVGGKTLNRTPRADEVAANLVWLRGELGVIRPKIVLCLGNIAAATLIHKGFKMNEERGQWFEGPLASRAIATFHPSYVLRQLGPDRERLVALMKQDVEEVRQALATLQDSPRSQRH